jgi:hypothetical protein
MKLIKTWIATLLLVSSLGGALITVAAPMPVSAAGSGCSSFLGFPAWYDGLTKGDCEIMSPNDPDVGGIQNFIMRIAMNVVGIVLVGVAYVSIGFILYAGLLLIKGITGESPGSPKIAATARKMILNACIGLVLSLIAITVVDFIASIYTGEPLNSFGLPKIAADTVLQTALNMFYFVIGAASVIVMIIAGYMFTAGGAEPSSIAQAKNMIYYSVAGLVVSILAFTITGFIMDKIG